MALNDKEASPHKPADAAGLAPDFQALFDASPTPLLVVAPPDWTIVAANDARLRVTHTTREEQIGRRLFEVFPDHSEDPDADGVRNLTASLERVVATKVADAMPVQRYAVRGPDGQFVQRWWAPVNTPVLAPDGEVALIIHQAEDVTEVVRLRGDADGHAEQVRNQQIVIDRLRASETALRESEARFRLMADAVPQIVWITDPQGHVEFFNKQWYDYTGTTPKASTAAQVAADHVHPADGPATIAAFEEALRTGTTFLVEHRIRSAGGEYRWFLVRGEPHRDPATGEIVRWFGASVDIHDRKLAEEQLRDSEARYRTLFEAIEVGFCVIEVIFDGDGRPVDYLYVEANPAFAAQAGFGDPVGRRVREIVPDHEERWFQLYGEVVLTGASVRFEQEAAGLGRWFDVHAFRTGDPAQRRVAVLFSDITPRRQAELALRELNANLEQKVEARTAERDRVWRHSLDLLSVIDMDRAAFDTVNPAWTAALGWSVEEIEGRPYADFVHPDDTEASADAFAQVCAGNPVLRFENRYRTKAGGWRWLSWVAMPEGGKLYSVTRDVTADKDRAAELAAAEAARRQADQLYRAYFENTAEALFVIAVQPDGGFVVEDLNPAHQVSTGLKLAEIRGRRIEEVLPAAWVESVTGYYRRVIASGEVYQFRESYEVRGLPSWWDTTLVPVRNADGRISQIIGASRDITAQMTAEEALRQSQKMEAMGQLTGGVAHDFNNLLTPIIGSLDLVLRKGVGDARERRLMDGALQSAERARTLVQRLLAFARRQPLQPVPVDLAQLVRGMAELIGSTLGPNIDVRVELGPDLPPAKADPNQLEMALLNLAVNARDAMPDGGTLTVTAERTSVRGGHAADLRTGNYIRLNVRDTGSGMDEETARRAVEPFFSTKGVGKGTGLGLSMVHGLAAQLGGGLTIDSAPGRGTAVELWLPLSAEPVDDGEQEAPLGPENVGRGTALLVDDEELVRLSTADMLGDLGFEVVEAASAEEALEMMRGGTAPDILVTDHLMPGMTGTDLAREARALRPGLPVLVVSGYAEVDGIAPDLPRLTKPFRSTELAARVAALVAGG